MNSNLTFNRNLENKKVSFLTSRINSTQLSFPKKERKKEKIIEFTSIQIEIISTISNFSNNNTTNRYMKPNEATNIFDYQENTHFHHFEREYQVYQDGRK